MPSVPASLPKPLSAYVGLLASTAQTARDAVRQGPAGAVRLPLLALTEVLSSRERYNELAERGEILLHRILTRFGSPARYLDRASEAAAGRAAAPGHRVAGRGAGVSGRADSARAAAREASDRGGAGIEEARRKGRGL